MAIVRYYDIMFDPPGSLMYSVVAARYESRWIFVRHQGRNTWEIPGGHIEKSETPSAAASRELTEETGAAEFGIVCVATYSVEKDSSTGYGKLYFAEVTKMGELPGNSEIAEVIMKDDLPENLTYPDIQPHLFKRINEYLKTKS
jgi:8-oxo-dGTP diphosphatase